jgi:hypothetical protein
MGKPARNYSWSPFPKGHKLSLRHGAFSKQVTHPIARELITGLLSDRPDLVAYPEAVASWADNEARAFVMRQWLDSRRQLLTGDGIVEGVAGVLDWMSRFDKRAADARARLGLDPVSEANLAKLRADASHSIEDLESLRVKGAQILDAREVAEAGEIEEVAG